MIMETNKGLTLIELLILLTILGILITILFPGFFNLTQINSDERGQENLAYFVKVNKLNVKRSSCASDLENGYVSCSLVTTDNEKIYLKCPATKYNGKNCKELPVARFK